MCNIRSHSRRLVLYQVKDLCGIKSGHCVVSSPIYVLMYWGGMHVLWSCVVSRLKSCVVSRLESCFLLSLVLRCINTVNFCCINSGLVLYQSNASHRWCPMRMDLQLWIWTCVVSSHVVILCDTFLVMVTECYKSPLGFSYN